jgi:hypothetical protein
MEMSEQQPLFEVISEDEFRKAGAPKAKGHRTEPRTLTVWFALPTTMGFCTVPSHVEIQRQLNPEEQEYRDKYPTRMIFKIGEYFVCRDCFVVGGDLE